MCEGERGSLVVYADRIRLPARSRSASAEAGRTEIDESTGDEEEREIPFMKGYTAFNVEQIEGLPERYYAQAAPRLDPVQRIEHADAFFAATGADIRHGGNQAYYTMAEDRVQMPPFESFHADFPYQEIAAVGISAPVAVSVLQIPARRRRWRAFFYCGLRQLMYGIVRQFFVQDTSL